jgi:hypothetical protein
MTVFGFVELKNSDFMDFLKWNGREVKNLGIFLKWNGREVRNLKEFWSEIGEKLGIFWDEMAGKLEIWGIFEVRWPGS